MAKFPEAEARLLNVKICMHCNSRDQLPQVRLPEPAPKEQGKKGVIFFFNIFSFFYVIIRF